MVYVCVRDVMDVVFSVCIMRRGSVGARISSCRCCILCASCGSSQCCVLAMGGSAVLFILRSILLVYSAGYGMNRVQVVLSGFSVILLYFVQTKTLCRLNDFFWLHSCLYVLM